MKQEARIKWRCSVMYGGDRKESGDYSDYFIPCYPEFGLRFRGLMWGLMLGLRVQGFKVQELRARGLGILVTGSSRFFFYASRLQAPSDGSYTGNARGGSLNLNRKPRGSFPKLLFPKWGKSF